MRNMTKIDFIKTVQNDAVEYIMYGPLASMARNKHMNNYQDEQVSYETLLALFTDFINYVARQQGVDYGLYTSDMENEIDKKNEC